MKMIDVAFPTVVINRRNSTCTPRIVGKLVKKNMTSVSLTRHLSIDWTLSLFSLFLRSIWFVVIAPSALLADEQFVMSCSDAPKDAVITVAVPATQLVGVACTRYGHVLTAADNWKWILPAVGTPVFLPAQLDSKPKNVGHSIYFKTISPKILDAKNAWAKWAVLQPYFHEADSIDSALEIAVTTSESKAASLYIFKNGFGYLCTPRCSAQKAFIILNRDHQKPMW